jgi:acyl-CoA synthetase (NDP forming)
MRPPSGADTALLTAPVWRSEPRAHAERDERRKGLAAGFAGPVHVVNPNHGFIEGISTVKSIDAIVGTPDVVVIAVPPAAVPETVAAAGAKGAAAAIIITAGLGHGPGSLAVAADRAARATGLRLVGPNSLGVLVPPSHFNASFAPRRGRAISPSSRSPAPSSPA